MIHYHSDPATVAAFTAALRMPESVVHAWLSCEGQDDANLSPYNPLNIIVGGTPGQSGRAGNSPTATYASLGDGAHWTGWLIDHGPYAGIRAARATGDPYQIARAIEFSPWAASRYGASPSHDGCVSEQVRHLPAPKPPASSGPLDRPLNPVPFTAHRRAILPGGTHLYDFPGGAIVRTLPSLTALAYVAATAEWLLVGPPPGVPDELFWVPRHDPLTVDDLDAEVGA